MSESENIKTAFKAAETRLTTLNYVPFIDEGTIPPLSSNNNGIKVQSQKGISNK